MLRRKIIGYCIVVLMFFIAIWLVITYMNARVEYYQVFEDERELFEAVKDEVESMQVSKLGYRSHSGDTFLYRNGGNAAPDQFHDGMSANLRGRIEQINELSGDTLDQLRYTESGGKILIRFIFDWERAYGDTYHIVYSRSRDGVVKLYDDGEVKYDDLKELDEDWFGTRIGQIEHISSL